MNEISRRSVLKLIGGVGASFAIGSFSFGSADGADEKIAFAPNAFVKIDPDGTVYVTVAQPDMGQGVRTSLAMLIAEDLDADWQKIKIIQAPANADLYGRQGVGGSGSVRGNYKRLRTLGATTRAMLVAAAAQVLKVEPTVLSTSDGYVVHAATGKKIPYGELTTVAATVPIPSDVPLKDKSEFKLLRKPTRRVDNPLVVTGKAIYGIDSRCENMAYAVILRSPSVGGKLAKVDIAAAKAVEGVHDVIPFDGSHAVLATNSWSAIKGRDALKAEWTKGEDPDLSSAAILAKQKAALIQHLPMPDGSKIIDAEIVFPYLAHATMEPMNALADVREGKCTVWASTQQPDGAQRMVAKMLNLQPSDVTINVTLVGGGFGRRLSNDYIAEAVNLSQAAKRPVKLLWTREDDMTNDNYRPACLSSIRAAVDSQGQPVGWSHQAIQAGGGSRDKFGNAGLQYEIPNSGLLFGGVPVPISTGAWRSVENTLLNVAHECVIDEMAHAAGKDPLDFRLSMLKNERLRTVLKTAAEKGDWGKPLPAGTGRGIACFAGYGSYAAHCIEVTVTNNQIKLNRVVAVMDCGIAINPKGVEAQVQGACVDGLSTALFAEITVEDGQIKQKNFNRYRWMTMDEMPKIEVVILENGDSPGGLGEPGYPSCPPAVANAVAAATGKRVRRFPIRVDELA